MSRKKLFAILAAESVAIIALYVLTARMQETFSAIYNFPLSRSDSACARCTGLEVLA